jgi:hypothetical protein
MSRLASLAALAAAVASLLAPAGADAIPAFARRYRFSCNTCHAPFPKLKPYGDEFAARGFALEPGQEPARAQVDLGDDLLQLPREFPVAVRFDAFALAQDGDPAVDFQTPWVFKVLAGGQIGSGVSVYGYYILEHGEPGKIEDMFLTWSRPFGAPLDFTIGQFQISDAIAKRELRLSRLDYEILKVAPGLSRVDLTYDRGIVLASDIGPVGAVLTVTNGTGIGPGTPTLDDDKYKNFGLHLSGDVGPVSLGAYGFVGTELGELLVKNETVILGPQVGFSMRDLFDVSVVWLERRDSNATFDPAGAPELRTSGGFVEVVGYPQGHDGRWVVSALYNYVDSDDPAAERDLGGLAVTWLLRRNVRVVAEGDWDFDADGWSASLGTVAAF